MRYVFTHAIVAHFFRRVDMMRTKLLLHKKQSRYDRLLLKVFAEALQETKKGLAKGSTKNKQAKGSDEVRGWFLL